LRNAGIHQQYMGRTRWSSGNNLDLYLVGARFEFRPGH
jgi:hypothetical protein